MTKQLILILGGARSGKTTYAEKLALELGGRDVLYVATAQAHDDEMRDRIVAHLAARPRGWRTLEASSLVTGWRAEELAAVQVVLLDCVTLLASNALLAAGDEPSIQKGDAAIAREIAALLGAYQAGLATWIVVSNEVGLGLVPPSELGRVYRDALGRANQTLASAADRVLLMVAGLPMSVK